jgi:hypothetical protein
MDTMGMGIWPSGPVTVCMGMVGFAHDMVMVSKPSMAWLVVVGSAWELVGGGAAHARDKAV